MVFLPEVREMAPFGRGTLFHKFLRNANFYLTSKNPSIFQLDLISGYRDFLRPHGKEKTTNPCVA